MFRLVLVLALTASSFSLRAQETDLLKGVEDTTAKKQKVGGIFKSPRVIMGESVEMLNKKVLDVRILHRFSPVNNGISDFFGLDQAVMRFSFSYGITDNVTIEAGRSTYQGEYDGLVKLRLLQQSKGPGAFPFSLVYTGGMMFDNATLDPAIDKQFKSHLAYYHTVAIGRKFTERFSFQVSPLFVHSNTPAPENTDENAFALGFGGRFKFAKRFALVADYYHVMSGINRDVYTDPLSIGVDIETGGHVFQLHFSNSMGLNERAFVTETSGKWGKGEIRFGFNLSRIFNFNHHKKDWDNN